MQKSTLVLGSLKSKISLVFQGLIFSSKFHHMSYEIGGISVTYGKEEWMIGPEEFLSCIDGVADDYRFGG